MNDCAICAYLGLNLLRAAVPDAAVAILQYFDQTYVNGVERCVTNTDIARRIEPTFPPPVWNVHDITVNAGDRTNNYCEAWKGRFETLVGHKSPSVWTTLEVLGDDAAEAATMLVCHSSDRLKPSCVV